MLEASDDEMQNKLAKRVDDLEAQNFVLAQFVTALMACTSPKDRDAVTRAVTSTRYQGPSKIAADQMLARIQLGSR